MSGFSNSLANAIINATLRGVAWPTIHNVYFALFTDDPTDGFSSGKEVSAGWYTRVLAGTFAAPSAGVSYNSTSPAFPAVTGSSVTITHIGIVEGTSTTDVGSTLMYSWPLAEPLTLDVGGIYLVQNNGATGDVTISLV